MNVHCFEIYHVLYHVLSFENLVVPVPCVFTFSPADYNHFRLQRECNIRMNHVNEFGKSSVHFSPFFFQSLACIGTINLVGNYEHGNLF